MLNRYDRYVLSQYLLFFGFFSLVLVAVFWINRAVSLFDRLIGNGQSVMVFLEFSALALPNLIRMIVPMSAFAAAVYVTNRLSSESELTVMQATGSSPWRLARPALAFGIVTALMMSVLTHTLLPMSIDRIAQRQIEISRNMTARLLSEGAFLNPATGVTFYIGEIDPDGTLNDVFLSDRRKPAETIIYTASRAFLVRGDQSSNLIMVDGLAQRFNVAEGSLSTTNFSDFSYDITTLVERSETRNRDIRQVSTVELALDADRIMQTEGYTAGEITEQLHVRFDRALICISVALLGFSTLMLGGFSRFGIWRQILFAFVILVALELMRGMVNDPVIDDPALWPLIYLPAATGVVISALFLYLAAYPLPRLGRQRDTTGTEVAT